MAGSKADYWENALLQHLFKSDFSAPTTLYVALYLASDKPTDTNAGTEVSTAGTAYARQGVARNTGWTLSTNTITNAADINYTQATADWGSVGAFQLLSTASGAGNAYYWGDLTAAKTISSGDTAKIAAGDIDITED